MSLLPSNDAFFHCDSSNVSLFSILRSSQLTFPIALISDKHSISHSAIYHCLATLLLAQTPSFLYDVSEWVAGIKKLDEGDDDDFDYEDDYSNNSSKFKAFERSLSVGPSSIVLYTRPVHFLAFPWGEPLDRQATNMKWNSRARILVITEHLEEVQLWLETLWNKTFAIDATVAVLDKENFFTWFPYRPPHCRKVSNIAQVDKEHLFPAKLSGDLQGCAITAIKEDTDSILRQSEVKILNAIASKLNLRVEYLKKPNQKEQLIWILLQVGSNVADLTFGRGQMNHFIYKYLETVVSHGEDVQGWVCPAPRPFHGVGVLLIAFSKDLWLCVLGTSVCIALVYRILNKEKETDTLMVLVAIILNLDSPSPKKILLRLFVTVCYLYSICIVATYGGALFKVLQTVPRHTSFETLQDLLDSNLKYYAKDDLYSGSVFAAVAGVPQELFTADRIVVFNETPVVKIADGKAFMMLPQSQLSFMLKSTKLYWDKYDHPVISFLPGTSSTEHLSFHMSPGHPLLPFFNLLTQRLVEGGLPNFWAQFGLASKRYLHRSIHRPIDIFLLSGPFALLVLFHVLSTLVFVHEMWVIAAIKKLNRARMKKMRTIFKVHRAFATVNR